MAQGTRLPFHSPAMPGFLDEMFASLDSSQEVQDKVRAQLKAAARSFWKMNCCSSQSQSYSEARLICAPAHDGSGSSVLNSVMLLRGRNVYVLSLIV